MQIIYSTNTNISTYFKSVLAKKWKFPDFSDACPICNSKNCAVRIGFYWRKVFSFKDNKYIRIPVARYLCKRKNKARRKLKSSHKTFSLLPAQCIPYNLYDIDSLMYMAKMYFIHKKALLEVATEFVVFSENCDINVSTVLKYLLLLKAGHDKLNMHLKLKYDHYSQTINYINDYPPGRLKFIEKIYKKYSFFLFGIPSHLRCTG